MLFAFQICKYVLNMSFYFKSWPTSCYIKKPLGYSFISSKRSRNFKHYKLHALIKKTVMVSSFLDRRMLTTRNMEFNKIPIVLIILIKRAVAISCPTSRQFIGNCFVLSDTPQENWYYFFILIGSNSFLVKEWVETKICRMMRLSLISFSPLLSYLTLF